MNKQLIYRKYIKRIIDIVLSFILLLTLSPLLLIIGILVKIKLGSPIFFCQERVGKNNKVFKMYKFRTMTNDKDSNGELLDESFRMTKFGKKLRSTSLDELPELFNILRGEMSLIGPRPLPVKYLHLYDENQIRRHEIKPGLTGLAQISGRNNLDWNERFELDVYYVDNYSFKLDVSILFKTVSTVMSKEGIHTEKDGVISAFRGNDEEHEK